MRSRSIGPNVNDAPWVPILLRSHQIVTRPIARPIATKGATWSRRRPLMVIFFNHKYQQEGCREGAGCCLGEQGQGKAKKSESVGFPSRAGVIVNKFYP